MTRKVLLLASYCGDDDPSCTDDLPCLECLKMCNIADQQPGPITGNVGGWGFNRQIRETGLPRKAAIEKIVIAAARKIAGSMRMQPR